MGRYHVIVITKDGEKLKHETDDLQKALSMLTSTSVKVIDTQALVGKQSTSMVQRRSGTNWANVCPICIR
jgi:hypothetical protein